MSETESRRLADPRSCLWTSFVARRPSGRRATEQQVRRQLLRRRRRSAGSPIGHLLRSRYPDVWVRFHSLPQSRRYLENEADYIELLHRHNTVSTELFADTEVYLVRSMFRPTDVVPEMADFAHWSSVMTQDDPDPLFRSWSHLFCRRLHWRWGVLDTLLREVADDREGGLFVTDVELRGIYRPYDRGACAVRVVGRTGPAAPRHFDWLSRHPSGR